MTDQYASLPGRLRAVLRNAPAARDAVNLVELLLTASAFGLAGEVWFALGAADWAKRIPRRAAGGRIELRTDPTGGSPSTELLLPVTLERARRHLGNISLDGLVQSRLECELD